MDDNSQKILKALLNNIEENESRLHNVLNQTNLRIEENKKSIKKADLSQIPPNIRKEINTFINTNIKKIPPEDTTSTNKPKGKRSTKQRETV